MIDRGIPLHHPTFGTKITATVCNRRGEGWSVRPEAEQLDGNRYTFRFAWHIEDEDSSLYAGETAWTPHPMPISGKESKWPKDAPSWIASGDLCDVVLMTEPRRTNGEATWVN